MTRRRPGPLGPCDDAMLLEHIKRAIAESRFTGEGYRKIWAKLHFAGSHTSPGRLRRLRRSMSARGSRHAWPWLAPMTAASMSATFRWPRTLAAFVWTCCARPKVVSFDRAWRKGTSWQRTA